MTLACIYSIISEMRQLQKHEKEDSMMTNFYERGMCTKIKRVFQTTASLLCFIAVFVAMMTLEQTPAYADTEEDGVWVIIVGDEEFTYVASEKAGQRVIDGLEDYYVSDDATVLDVEITPAVSVEFVEDAPEGAEIDTAKQVVQELCEDGVVDVRTVEKVKSKETIRYRTVYRKTKSLKYGWSKVDTKGKNGSKMVVRKVTSVNGEKVSSRIISSKKLKNARSKVILRGTANVTARKGKTFKFKTGEDVVEYAKRFIGNPYKYGGSSLTRGSDCSGFVYAVYKNMGVNLPRCDQENVGKKVSYKNVKKGDILFYYGHVAIYAGNGKAIHAVNERMGIRITDAEYTGEVIKVRRIFE